MIGVGAGAVPANVDFACHRSRVRGVDGCGRSGLPRRVPPRRSWPAPNSALLVGAATARRHERDRDTEATSEPVGSSRVLQTANYVTLPPASMILRKTRSCIHFVSHHSTGLTGVPLTSTVKCR